VSTSGAKKPLALAAALLGAVSLTLVAPSAAHAAAPPCVNADLKASFRVLGSGMSQTYANLVLTNVSGHACTTGGYGGLSYVGHGNGTQIGRAARRDKSPAPRVVTVPPGGRVVSRVDMVSTGPYDKKVCRPTKVDGLRVYVPNSHVSQFVPVTSWKLAKHTSVTTWSACANRRLRTLSHEAYRLAK